MPMNVEAVIVSRKSANLAFNTDGVNAAGKIWDREVVHSEKGIRAVGLGKDDPYYVLSSSELKGTAESAADLFSNCSQGFLPNEDNRAEVIGEFFRAFAKVLVDSGFSSSACDFSVFVGAGHKAYLATMGKSHVFKYTDGACAEVHPDFRSFPDNASGFGVACDENVKVDDVYVLLPDAVTDVLMPEVIGDILRNAQGDMKKAISVLASQAVKRGCTDAVSAILLKVTQVDEKPEAVPGFVFPAEVETDLPEEEVKETPAEETEEPSTVAVGKGKKALFIIVTTLLAILLLAIVFFVVRAFSGNSPKPADPTTTAPETTTEPESTTKETTTAETTTGETTTAETTTAETTTARREEGGRTPEPTRAPEPTEEPTQEEPTEEPPTEEPTSEEPTQEIPTEEPTSEQTVTEEPTEAPTSVEEPEPSEEPTEDSED